MNLRGKLHAEAAIYRGNSRKTLFTRDGDGKQRLVSLAGEIAGTAQSLMDAFIGQSQNGRNLGLINRLWQRLYGRALPNGLISKVECRLQESSYTSDHLFDLRMGMKLDEDRWASEANANYKMETLLRHSVFDFTMQVNDRALQEDGNGDKLYYLLQEISAGRFWFGAGKSKGLGRCRLEMDLPFKPAAGQPLVNVGVNHLTILCTFDASNPLLVGWNWGKVDPAVPAFVAVEGRMLLEAMRGLPTPIRQRLEMTIGGPLLNAADWKGKLRNYLPRATAIWLREQSAGEHESWTLPATELSKLGKDKKYPLSAKLIAAVQPLTITTFATKVEAEAAINQALGGKSNMAGRILAVMVKQKQSGYTLNRAAWQEVASGLNLDPGLGEQLAQEIGNEADFTATIAQACVALLPQLNEQIDRQMRMMNSDTWVDVEIANREEHVKIKEMLRDGKINESQWENANQPPAGVTPAAWREFLFSHQRVRFQHMLAPANLNKSITNDRNFIDFLTTYRQRTRSELVQPIHITARAGDTTARPVTKRFGKNYDNVFMRMLTWKPSAQNETAWEVYIPGGTLKGAFRRRASQVLKTLWGETERTSRMIDWLFGRQGQVGRIFFSDAYLVDPNNTESAWCSMDGIRLDPKTAQPIESAKMDFLYAYGEQLKFGIRLDLQDLALNDSEAILVLQHLLADFQQGDIPIGGEKGAGLGWVQMKIAALDWFTGKADELTTRLFPGQVPVRNGLWQTISLGDAAAKQVLTPSAPLSREKAKSSTTTPPKASMGFITHRAFGGYCGTLFLEAEVLRPLHIRESGEASFSTQIGNTSVEGWDFFAMASPEAELRSANKTYALPSRSLRGMVRHLYAAASNSRGESSDLSRLNPVDSLFGWVGSGPNQAIMGRLAFSFGLLSNPQFEWYKVPAYYGGWHYRDGRWVQIEEGKAKNLVIADTWRIFPHAPLAPVVQQLSYFAADTSQSDLLRAVMPGSKATFSVRFWNLEERELQRLLWSLTLEDGLAHKLGKHRYVGFGSLRIRLQPESFLTDWAERYTPQATDAGRLPLEAGPWQNTSVIENYQGLKSALAFA